LHGGSDRGNSPARQLKEKIMHPMFVTLFLDTDSDDVLTEEQDRKRRVRAAKRASSARVVRAAARADRPRRA
jgi:hypothetical protein